MKPNYESSLIHPEPTKAKEQTGIRYPTMLSPKHRLYITLNIRPGITNVSLKPKGLGGA